jgi:hypothetical protein
LSKTLLLISAKPDDLAFAKEVASVAGVALKHARDPKAGAQMVAREDISIIFADTSSEEQYQEFENALHETVGLFSDRIHTNAIHFLSNEDLENIKYLIQSPLFGHFIHRNYGDTRDAGQHYGRIVKATLAEKAFGLATLLSPDARIQVVKLNHSSQKPSAVEAIKSFLSSAKFQTRVISIVANAVDELLMNSIFDAPIDEMGKQLLSSTPRSAQVPLEGQNAVEMHVGYDGKYIAVSAVDFFGSVEKGKLLNHISKIYNQEDYKAKMGVAGAGLGLGTVFRSGGSFFVVSESRVRTEVTVFFKKTFNFRDFRDQFRFISTQFYF